MLLHPPNLMNLSFGNEYGIIEGKGRIRSEPKKEDTNPKDEPSSGRVLIIRNNTKIFFRLSSKESVDCFWILSDINHSREHHVSVLGTHCTKHFLLRDRNLWAVFYLISTILSKSSFHQKHLGFFQLNVSTLILLHHNGYSHHDTRSDCISWR